MEQPENKPYIELNPSQFGFYEKYMTSLEIPLKESGYPVSFPELSEDELLIAELNDHFGDRRLFIVYSFWDMKSLLESYVIGPPEGDKGKITWHKCPKKRGS